MEKFFINYHKNKYPLMTNQDIIKLVYQETLGPNHIILTKETTLKYILNELNEISNANNNLYEYIGPNYVRMDIHKYYKYYNEVESLNNLFFNSISTNNDKEILRNNLKDLIPYDVLNEYNLEPVSHSEIFRKSYFPHYRIIKSTFLTLEIKLKQISNFIDKLPSKSIISLEGRCASGKTTLCDNIKDKYTILAIDDFFLPFKSKTKERLEEIGGNINYELVKETLENLKDSLSNNSKTFTYTAFDCSTQEYYEKEIILKDKVILEGVYSSSLYFRKYIDKIIYLFVDKKTQLDRINNRSLKERFINEWIPLEEKYFNYILIEDICDLIV